MEIQGRSQLGEISWPILSILTATIFPHSRMFAFLSQNQRRWPLPLPQPGYGPEILYYIMAVAFASPVLKGIYTPAGSLTFSNSGLPDHHSPTLWHWMLIILILLIHVTTRQQWNASWQSKRRRNGTNSEHSHCGCRPRNSWVTRNDRVHEGQWNG